MDRRQKKTREAIFAAFTELMDHENYSSITVQKIIDSADIGRSTFYAHFETKDDLLRELCRELFAHILETARDRSHSRCLYYSPGENDSVFLHILLHLKENDRNILRLLSCESHEVFMHYFKECMDGLVREHLLHNAKPAREDVPVEFLISHISGGFVNMVEWWLSGHRHQTPQELDRCFSAMIDPLLVPR